MKNYTSFICAISIFVCTICIGLVTSIVIYVNVSNSQESIEDIIINNDSPIETNEIDAINNVKKQIVEEIKHNYSNVDSIDYIVDIVFEKAQKYDITLSTALAIIEMESNFNYKAARNGKGNDVSRGLTQITPLCLAEYNKKNNTTYELNYLNIEKSIEVGFWYINFLMNTYSHISSEEDAIIAYNVGPSKLRKMTYNDKRTYNSRRNRIYSKWQNFQALI